MLKNIARISLVAAAMLSTNAMAANFGSITAGTSNNVTPINCPALNNDVTIQLSKGVFAAYACSTSTVNAGACHTTGTNKSQTIGCSYTVTYDSAGSISGSDPSSTGCAAWDGFGSAPTGNTDTFTGRLGYRGGSGGGTVSQVELGSAACDGTSIDAIVN
jgi:hypothetical protein